MDYNRGGYILSQVLFTLKSKHFCLNKSFSYRVAPQSVRLTLMYV